MREPRRRRRRRAAQQRRTRLGVTAALGVLLLVAIPVFLAANSVPASRAGDSSRGITGNDLKPNICNNINIENVVLNGGNGGNRNDLILGTPAANGSNGGGGADCIVVGGGNDNPSGAAGNDVIDGGPGLDICNGGAGTDQGFNCETSLQIP